MLRQDPVECLFEFICSSNNHISRIKGMVERLCQDYGTPLTQQSGEQTWFVCSDEFLLGSRQARNHASPMFLPAATMTATVQMPCRPGVTMPSTLRGPRQPRTAPVPVTATLQMPYRTGLEQPLALLASSPGQTAHFQVSDCHNADASTAAVLEAKQSINSAQAPLGQAAATSDLAFHAFPSIQQLSAATEDALRAQGFGYR